ncbi:MAG: transglutaminase [Candidatus Aureabacteria bacterium]|nr:transglutaminase [Candidatus Auribacterota bacterium]
MKKTIVFGFVCLLAAALPAQAWPAGKGFSLDVEAVLKEARTAADPARARLATWRAEAVRKEFPFDRAAAEKNLAERLPDLSEKGRAAFLDDPSTERVTINDTVYYFASIADNARFRNIPLMRSAVAKHGTGDPFIEQTRDIAFRSAAAGPVSPPWKPFSNPKSYLVEGEFNIPRSEMPADGLVQIWIPVAIQTACQDGARLLQVSPEKYVRALPEIDGDIGSLYLEVPLADLTDDLKIAVRSRFTHYEQRFRVDPEMIGPYDKGSALYRTYTASHGNIVVTPEIERRAKEIVGKEANPYRAARRIYDYILKNLPYSFVPHLTVAVLKKPEAVYAHEFGCGDCGTQSMYFAALCRAAGIPARSTGGYQLIPGHAGAHFWAEFYLPNYGWIPVDPTIADTADWAAKLTDEERARYKDFCFGGQDPYRYVTQRDVDIPLSPCPEEPILSDEALEGAIQDPAIVCTASKENPGRWAEKYWKVTFTPIE